MKTKSKRIPVISLIFIVIFVLNGLFCTLLAPHDAVEANLIKKFTPPVFMGGTWEFPLGTDALGRDILSRIMLGGRIALIVCVLAILIGGITGSVLGIISGYFGGTVDAFIMRFTDASIAFPSILLALLLSLTIHLFY